MSPTSATTPHDATGTRPRVEGDREQQIYDAALDALAEVGYDRLTMDAVAAGARASKATLYRRWASKAELVIEALQSQKGPHVVADTGTLRGDLLSTFCGMGGLTDTRQTAILTSVLTAVGRDHEFAQAFRRDFIGPKAAQTHGIFDRAQARGEISHDLDLDVVVAALPGIVLHRQFFFGEAADEQFVARVIDHVILPAVGVGQRTPQTTHHTKDPS